MLYSSLWENEYGKQINFQYILVPFSIIKVMYRSCSECFFDKLTDTHSS